MKIPHVNLWVIPAIIANTFLFLLILYFPQVHADPTFRIAVTGDISCSGNGQNTVNQIINQNPSLVLWLGDLSYVDSDVNCFISQTSQLASKDEAIVGNHDDSEDGTSAARTQLINHFGIPSTGYYSKNYDVLGTKRTDDVLLIGMDTQSKIDTSSSQYKFVENTLKSSNAPLKIIMVHKPFLSCSCEHTSNGQFTAYHALFSLYGVDLVLQGHNHNIQYFNVIDNVKYIVSGAGGKSHYSLTSTPKPTHYRDDTNYGFTLIDADFATYQLQGKFITNSGTDKSTSHFTQSFYQNSIPVANEQSVTVNKNNGKTIVLTASDPDNDPLTYSIVTQPLHGMLSAGTGASYIYTPATGYAGPDTFTFKTNDGYIDSNTATVSITVQNGPPIANDQSITVNKNTQQPITLEATDPNNDPLSYTIMSSPLHGTLSPAGTSGPSRTYTPATGHVGPDTFTFKTNDGYIDSNTATVSITVQNGPPIANDQSITVNKNTQQSITLEATDPNNDPLSYTIMSSPLHGTLSPAGTSGASRTYTPATGYAGPDTFTFKTNDGYIDSNTATVSITVQNGPPIANDQSITVNKNTQQPITLEATDPNNDPLSYTVVSSPLHGTLSPSGTAEPEPKITYTPTDNYLGSDGFTFKANDGTVNSNTATVNINVIEQPQGSYNYSPSFVATGSNYRDIADSGSLRLTQFSVATWFKTSTDFATDSMMVNKGGLGTDTAGQNMNYGIWMTGAEKIKAGFETSSGADQYVTSPNSYNDGRWHYVVVTNDGSTLRLYIDGVEVATKALLGATPENTGTKPVRIGANSRITPPGNFFVGELDEIRVWSVSITAQQVRSAFAGTDFTTSKQVLYLAFGGYIYSPALMLSGTNYQDTPDSASLRLTQFSVATWFKTSTDFVTDSMMVNKGGLGTDTAGQNMNYGIWMTGAEKIKAGFETSSGADQYVTSTNSYNDGRWHYVIVTNDGSTLRLYVDGVQVGTKSLLGASPENTGTKPVRIGANSRITPPGNFFTGELDEIRIWNIGLTAQQVTSAFAGTEFTTSKQVSYLDFTAVKSANKDDFDPSMIVLPR